jgi:CRISPR-associated endonuclease/helicase Cas3
MAAEATAEIPSFERAFEALSDSYPFRWQARLFDQLLNGKIPSCCDLPTGLGKTSVMTIWLIALALGRNRTLPRRLVYVVDRRVVVDQATEVAEMLRCRLQEEPDLAPLARDLGLDGQDGLPVSTLRGQHVDNRLWLRDPAKPAIVVGTVDMIGSRLLFSGYGVSTRMRPVQAGLLGADALVVLDEAHLCPPFEALLRTIARDEQNAFGPRDADVRDIVPRFRLLSLSATGRGDGAAEKEEVFGLEPEDRQDQVVRQRLTAAKRLKLGELDRAQKLAATLAELAVELAPAEAPARVLVYCRIREDALAVKDAIDKQRKKADREHVSELLVGARRVHERTKLSHWLMKHGFLGGPVGPPDRPTFLIATSAGEVGIDLDADHIVCDLVEWERMVQRLGRVNRRGEKESRIEVIAAPRDREKPEEWAKRLADLRAPLELLPVDEAGARDASPGALVALKERAADDPQLKKAIEAATTPVPMRPALSRALVDAWSLTSLEEHTGRPEVQPWLRGWVQDEAQTTLAWRRWLPWPDGLRTPVDDDVNRFFAAAPVHLEEKLETETHRVVDLLTRRATTAMDVAREDGAADDSSALKPNTPALIVLGGDLRLRRSLTLQALADLMDDKRRREEAFAYMTGSTVIVNACLGGLDDDGMLNAEWDDSPATLDGGWDEDALALIGYRVVGPGEPEVPAAWKLETSIALASPEGSEADDERPLRVFVSRGPAAPRRGDPAIASQPQLLDEHHAWAEEEARAIATALGLPSDYREMLAAAALHHDAGKDRELWQNAMNAPRNRRGPYAKTTGGGDPRRLSGYRHEFGSLRDAETSAALDGFDPDLRDLVLHLIAAHHGNGRPTVTPLDPGRPDAWESRAAQEERARAAALRFARLQHRFGPWGLAWLEAVLRAADWRASARLDEGLRRDDEQPEAAD